MTKFSPGNPILNEVKLDPSDLLPQASDKDSVIFQHPREVVFSHQFIQSELDKFSLDTQGCEKCSMLQKHFEDPRSNYDKLTEDGVTWIRNAEAIMTSPFPNLRTPIWDLTNIKLSSATPRLCRYNSGNSR